MSKQVTVAPVRRRPPPAVVVAVALAVPAALSVFVATAWWLADSGTWEVFAYLGLPTVLALVLLVGAAQLGSGRSWLTACVPATLLAGLSGWLLTWGLSSRGLVVISLFGVVCAGAGVAAVLPAARHWVGARRPVRPTAS